MRYLLERARLAREAREENGYCECREVEQKLQSKIAKVLGSKPVCLKCSKPIKVDP